MPGPFPYAGSRVSVPAAAVSSREYRVGKVMNILLLVIPILMLLMFSLGLELRTADFVNVVRRPGAAFIGFAACPGGRAAMPLPCLPAATWRFR